MNPRKRILITGASDYVGRHLVRRLVAANYPLTLASRTAGPWAGEGDVRCVAVNAVGSQTDWGAALEGCDSVVHLAAQLPSADVPDVVFDEVNDRGTARLVEQARQGGVEQLILISSVAAVAGHSASHTLDEDTLHRPSSPYGRSRLASEQHTLSFASPGRTVTILRPSVVYGGAAEGTWRPLQRLAASGLPLPFGAVHNRRSFTAVDNLIDAIFHLLSIPASQRQTGTFMFSDPDAVALTDILRWLRIGMGLPARLIPIPRPGLDLVLRHAGKSRLADSLLGDLEIDSSRFRRTFNWDPPVTTKVAVMRSGAEFMAQRKSKHVNLERRI